MQWSGTRCTDGNAILSRCELHLVIKVQEAGQVGSNEGSSPCLLQPCYSNTACPIHTAAIIEHLQCSRLHLSSLLQGVCPQLVSHAVKATAFAQMCSEDALRRCAWKILKLQLLHSRREVLILNRNLSSEILLA